MRHHIHFEIVNSQQTKNYSFSYKISVLLKLSINVVNFALTIFSIIMIECLESKLHGQAPIFISPASFTDVVDRDNDGAASKFTIEYQLQARSVDVEANVVAIIQRRAATAKSQPPKPWQHVYTSREYKISGIDYDDIEKINLGSDGQGLYEFRISAFLVGTSKPIARVLVGQIATEPPAQDRHGLRVMGFDNGMPFFFHNDRDQDGYGSRATLSYWLKLSDENRTVAAFEKVYWRPSGTKNWRLCYNGSKKTFLLPGGEQKITRKINIDTGFRGTYDYRLEVYQKGITGPVLVSDADTNNNLISRREEMIKDDSCPSPVASGQMHISTEYAQNMDMDDWAVQAELIVNVKQLATGPFKCYVQAYRWESTSDEWIIDTKSGTIDFSQFAQDDVTVMRISLEAGDPHYTFELHKVNSRTSEDIVIDIEGTFWPSHNLESGVDDDVFHKGIWHIPPLFTYEDFPESLVRFESEKYIPLEQPCTRNYRPDPEILTPRFWLSSTWDDNLNRINQEFEVIVTITENYRNGLSVEFYSDEELLGRGVQRDNEFSLKISELNDRLHFITAKVKTPEGKVFESNEIQVDLFPISDSPASVELEVSEDNISFGDMAELRAIASDSDGGILLVELLAGDRKITRMESFAENLYKTFVNALRPGKHQFRARATDTTGQVSYSPPVTIIVETAENSIPSIELAADPTTANHGAGIEFHATARDSDGQIDRVEFYEDNFLIGVQEFGPHDRFTFSIDTLNLGSHTIEARAVDDRGGNAVSNPVEVKIVQSANPSPEIFLEITPPSILAGNPVTLIATARDLNGPIAIVDFFDGERLIGSIEEGKDDQFRLVIENFTTGNHSLRARATDLDGDVKFSSLEILSVQVPDNDPPSVTLKLSGIEVKEGSEIVLEATASDNDGSIVQVSFFAGSTLLTTIEDSTNAIFMHTLNSLPVGEHFIVAKVTDDRGGESLSEEVKLTIIAASIQEPPNGDDPPDSESDKETPVAREIITEKEKATVQIFVTPPEDTLIYAVEELIPPGIKVSNISNGGTFANDSGILKWGPFFDDQKRIFSYELTKFENIDNSISITGNLSIDGNESVITGDSQLIPDSDSTSNLGSVLRLLEPSIGKIMVYPQNEVQVYAIEETIPVGIIPANISNGGFFDANTSKIKWGPFFDNAERTLSYSFEVSSKTSGALEWSGTGSFDGTNIPITGDNMMEITGNGVNEKLFISRTIGSKSVTLTASPPANTQVYAIEETVPEGITPENISDNGVFDPVLQKIKWGPFFDNIQRTLIYNYRINVNVTGTLTWAGIGSLDGVNSPVTGDTKSQITDNPVNVDPFVTRTIDGNLVVLEAIPPANTSVYSIEETLPEGIIGITEMEITDGGVFDPDLDTIKWGPFFDANPRTIAYTFSVAPDASGTLTFAGVASSDGTNSLIEGQSDLILSEPPDDIDIPEVNLTISNIPDAPSSFLLSWKSTVGKNYILETTESLNQPWESYVQAPIVAEGPVTVKTVTVGGNSRFFRVTVKK